MSGVKMIKYYTMSAFNGELNKFLMMQSRLEKMCAQMKQAAIHDEELNIHFDCSDSYKKLSSEIEKALVPLVFNYEGRFNERTHDLIENKINERAQKLSEVLDKADAVLSDFKSKQKDYDSFIDYKLFVKNAQSSFENYKVDLNENLEKSFAKENSALLEEAKKKYGVIAYEQESKGFNWGFDKIADAEKNTIVNHVLAKEDQIKDIKREMLDKIIASDSEHKITTNLKKSEDKPSDEVNKISQKIQLLINNCYDKTITSNYISLFNKLKHSESMNDLFFYQELHDRILENETTRKYKLFIKDIIASLNTAKTDSTLNQDKNFLLQKALRLINNSKVRENEINDLKKENELFFKKNRLAAEKAEIKKKEQLFVKSQIILNFENLGYEVMDDLRVIDFEKENDFYLKVPGQENLINIKFNDDGTFRYLFEIPEKKGDLSVDAQKMKLHEMSTTCGDFKTILDDLRKMGVAVDIKDEKPAELNSIITIPESVSTKLNTQINQTQRKQQIKKLYLE